MGKIALVVHGGAGQDSDHIKENFEGYKKGLADALAAGYKVLEENGSAVDAVEAAVNSLEDNPLFNAGRGSAINAMGEVEMCASIMNGAELNSGAVAVIKNVKNPVTLAKAIMLNTDYIYLAGTGALEYAKSINIKLEPDAYFVTEHQYDVYMKKRQDEFMSTRKIAREQIRQRMHGTVGAVAVDRKGNVAAATSTGGTENAKEGRIGDSSMIGVGTYANNLTAAISCTGDGEYLIRGVLAHNISSVMFHKGCSVQEACDYVVHELNKEIHGDIAGIAVTPKGEVGIAFNSPRLHRGVKVEGEKEVIKIYKEK